MKRILVADDSAFNLKIIKETLEPFYQVDTVEDGEAAIDFLHRNKNVINLLLLDIDMPGIDGIETFRRILQDEQLCRIPVVFLTGITDQEVEQTCLNLGARDFITKPFNVPVMLQRVRIVLELQGLRDNLEGQVQLKTQEIENLIAQTITSFANAIDAKDSYTKSHSYHVAQYAEQIGRRIGFSAHELHDLYYTALLHDIGKIGIPDYILNKPGKLTEKEYEVIKKHPVVGEKILGNVTMVPSLRIGAGNHHERYDGTGYPNGKKGSEIPLIGRIVGIADAVDAMRSERAYRTGMTVQETIAELRLCSGTQFDPRLVDVMCEILEDRAALQKVSEEMATSSQEASVGHMPMVRTDSLTGLIDNTSAAERINSQISDLDKMGALVLLDMDDFTRLSARSGCKESEHYIKRIAEMIAGGVRREDIVSRTHGNKFLIYLSGVQDRENIKRRIQLLERLVRAMLAAEGLPEMTMSCGIAVAPEDGGSFESLFCNADKALYHVKQQGKNGIWFYRK